MARTARKIISSGIYHIILRGINRQQIFFEESDFMYFINLLRKYKIISGYELYAYCLMGNHVHLLMRPREEPLSVIMKRIGGAFAYWYNGKYERTGHLFQDRFKSEVIDSEQYFIAAVRYILRNPVNAGLCARPGDYKYSSAGEYLFDEDGMTDTELAFALLGKDELRDFINRYDNTDSSSPYDYNGRTGDYHFIDIEEKVVIRQSDERARLLILQEFGTYSPASGKPGDRTKLYLSIRELVHKGISIRQLSRLTGLSKSIIERALRE